MSWRCLSTYQRLRWTAAAAALTAVIAASSTWFDAARESAHKRALAEVCGGLLPGGALRAVLPRDEDWERAPDGGRLLAPGGKDSRLLMSCGLTTGGGPGSGGVTVTAAPVLGRPLTEGVRVPSMVDQGYDESAPGPWAATDVEPPFDAYVDVRCAGGLPGARSDVDTFRVVTDVVATNVHGAVPDSDRVDDVEARTVATVANHIARTVGCGPGGDVRPTNVQPRYVRPSDVRTGAVPGAGGDGPRPADASAPASCAWVGKAGRELKVRDPWTRKGTGRLSWGDACTAAPAWSVGDPPGEDALSLTSGSWSGEAEREARLEYANELSALRRSGPVPRPPVPRRDSGATVRDPELVLWATSTCDDGTEALHRVSASSPGGRGLARASAVALDTYLHDPESWPRRNGCGEAQVLGRVRV